MNQKFKVRYSPLFYTDLDAITEYILSELQNETAARNFIGKVERSIQKQSGNPLGGAVYPSITKREHPYRRILAGNFLIFYVVVGGTMIVRRLLYGRRDLEKLID